MERDFLTELLNAVNEAFCWAKDPGMFNLLTPQEKHLLNIWREIEMAKAKSMKKPVKSKPAKKAKKGY